MGALTEPAQRFREAIADDTVAEQGLANDALQDDLGYPGREIAVSLKEWA